jgi:preprotein translocase subunit SecG
VTTREAARHRRPVAASGPEGNEHLTAITGAVLLIGFAIEGATIVAIHRFLWLHFVVGFLLIGPVLLKIGSTIYRFVQFYAGSPSYVRKGPPAPLLRVLGPLVVLTSAAVIGTGVALAFVGPGQGNWLFLHKATFILWFGVMTIHVLAYAPRLPRLLLRSADPRHPSPSAAPGGAIRWLALSAAIGVGVLVAALTMHLTGQWNGGFFVH